MILIYNIYSSVLSVHFNFILTCTSRCNCNAATHQYSGTTRVLYCYCRGHGSCIIIIDHHKMLKCSLFSNAFFTAYCTAVPLHGCSYLPSRCTAVHIFTSKSMATFSAKASTTWCTSSMPWSENVAPVVSAVAWLFMVHSTAKGFWPERGSCPVLKVPLAPEDRNPKLSSTSPT